MWLRPVWRSYSVNETRRHAAVSRGRVRPRSASSGIAPHERIARGDGASVARLSRRREQHRKCLEPAPLTSDNAATVATVVSVRPRPLTSVTSAAKGAFIRTPRKVGLDYSFVVQGNHWIGTRTQSASPCGRPSPFCWRRQSW